MSLIAHHAAVVAGLENDVFELLDVVEPAQRGERDLEILIVAHRRGADHAGGDLGILLANGPHDVAGCQVARGQLGRIDPDAHAVVALAHHVDVADAFRRGPVRP